LLGYPTTNIGEGIIKPIKLILRELLDKYFNTYQQEKDGDGKDDGVDVHAMLLLGLPKGSILEEKGNVMLNLFQHLLPNHHKIDPETSSG